MLDIILNVSGQAISTVRLDLKKYPVIETCFKYKQKCWNSKDRNDMAYKH
jgi:hypothetical protein